MVTLSMTSQIMNPSPINYKPFNTMRDYLFLKRFEGYRKPNRGLYTLYEIKTYTIQLLPKGNDSFNTQNSEGITTYQSRTEIFFLHMDHY